MSKHKPAAPQALKFSLLDGFCINCHVKQRVCAGAKPGSVTLLSFTWWLKVAASWRDAFRTVSGGVNKW